jgi:long-chain acyl-CoA synthetase
VKLQAGEYVSLGKVEAELKTCPLVENVCVYGDPSKHFTVALVVPNPGHLAALASKLGKHGIEFEQLCEDPQIEQAVLKELEEHGKKCISLMAQIFDAFIQRFLIFLQANWSGLRFQQL